MSIKMAMEIIELQADRKVMCERLEILEKAVNTLKRSVSHIERHGTKAGGVVVPQTALPDTLDQLEIGKHPQGT